MKKIIFLITRWLKIVCLVGSVYFMWMVIIDKGDDSIGYAIPFTIITIYIWRKFFDNDSVAFLSEDGLYDIIEGFVKERETITASVLQRKFKIGYARAASVLDSLEENGIIDSGDGANPRKVVK